MTGRKKNIKIKKKIKNQ